MRRNLAYHICSCLLVISIPPSSAVLHVHRTSISSSFLPPPQKQIQKSAAVFSPLRFRLYTISLSRGKSRGGCGKGYAPKIRWKADQKSVPGKACIKRPPLAFIKIRILKGKEANNIPNGGFISFPRASELGLFLETSFLRSIIFQFPAKECSYGGKEGEQ